MSPGSSTMSFHNTASNIFLAIRDLRISPWKNSKNHSLQMSLVKPLEKSVSISKRLSEIFPGETAGQTSGACLFVHSRLRRTPSQVKATTPTQLLSNPLGCVTNLSPHLLTSHLRHRWLSILTIFAEEYLSARRTRAFPAAYPASSSHISIMTIILYDIPSKTPTKAWSPNTWKTRCANRPLLSDTRTYSPRPRPVTDSHST